MTVREKGLYRGRERKFEDFSGQVIDPGIPHAGFEGFQENARAKVCQAGDRAMGSQLNALGKMPFVAD